MSLERFHQAQAAAHGGYAAALAEMRAGHKSSHWIWYIFPQIDGLGHSSMAQQYALQGLEETSAYLRDPLLSSRYEEIARVVAGHLDHGLSAEHLMGGRTDALKLASSITLFRAAALLMARTEPGTEFVALAALGDRILDHLESQGFPACAYTLGRVG